MSHGPSIRLTVLLGIPFVLLLSMIAVFVLVPYEVITYSINRRTGHQPSEITYWGIFSQPRSVNDSTPYYEKFGVFTAEERYMPYLRVSQRFPWSEREGEDIAPGSRYADVFNVLFSDLRGWSPSEGEQGIPAHEVDAATRQRIPIWNSNEVDRDPESIIGRIRKENHELHRRPKPAP